jgi:hypothetical protein
MKTETLFVDCILGDQLEEWCDKPPTDVGRGEVLFDEEVVFKDGTRMVIQATCSEDPTSEPIWTQGVLIGEEGTELGCTDVGESFYGEFQVDDYICLVKPLELGLTNN